MGKVETYFDHYVLGGGWAMLLLIPASIVTLAAAIRATLALRTGALVGPGPGSSVSVLFERLQKIRHRHGTLSAEDLRSEVDGEAIRLFSLLQPLTAMATLAPLAGLLGSVFALMSAHSDAARRGATEFLPAAVERALIPTMWGLLVCALATSAYLALRARLFFCERNLLRPAAEQIADELLGRVGRGELRRTGKTGKAGEESSEAVREASGRGKL